MKIFFLLLIFFSQHCFSQWNPNPTDSRLLNTARSTFEHKENDIYVYNVKTDTGNYTCIITLLKATDCLLFSYSIPEKSLSGKMNVTREAINNATKYATFFSDKGTDSTAISILWLSKKNMTELYLLKETTMDMGNGNENFHKAKNSIIKINFKGKQKIFTVYNIANEKGTIHVSVISDIRNPLIVKCDGPLNISLKEIR